MESMEELKALREELAERRRREVFWIGGAHHEDRLQKVATVQAAILAIDAVISEGKMPEATPGPSLTILYVKKSPAQRPGPRQSYSPCVGRTERPLARWLVGSTSHWGAGGRFLAKSGNTFSASFPNESLPTPPPPASWDSSGLIRLR
jgi:hypothetical protein